MALIEYGSIVVGTRAVDAIVKKAPITLCRVGSFQLGRFAVLFTGDVASTDESFVEGLRVGSDSVLDSVLLPDVDRSVYHAVLGRRGNWEHDTLGILESTTLAATIQAADAAVKGAQVEVIEIRLGDGLGGKGLVYFGGELPDVQAAIAIGLQRACVEPRVIASTVIPRWDPELRERLATSTRFGDGW